jgi:hypothetical protein
VSIAAGIFAFLGFAMALFGVWHDEWVDEWRQMTKARVVGFGLAVMAIATRISVQ